MIPVHIPGKTVYSRISRVYLLYLQDICVYLQNTAGLTLILAIYAQIWGYLCNKRLKWYELTVFPVLFVIFTK